MTNKHIIMANDEEVIVEGGEVVENQEEQNPNENQKPEVQKNFETPEAKRARLKRQLEQLDKKYPVEEKPEPSKSKSNDLDYGQKAFLVANGIKGTEEINLVKDIMQNTGKTLDEVLESKYFQSELQELRSEIATKNAIPSSSKRSNQSSDDTVEYWLAKGELPPESERELRLKVVNARLKKETNTNVFTSNPVVK